MASVYILFPKEQPELVHRAMQHFQWAVERFEAMSERNALARAALGVLAAIHIRLKKSIAQAASGGPYASVAAAAPPPVPRQGGTPATSASPGEAGFAGGSSTSVSVVGGRAGSLSSRLTPTTAGSEYYPTGGDNGADGNGNGNFDWSLPSNFDWSSIQPIYATGDLVYNDLVGIPDADGQAVQQWGAGAMGAGAGNGGVGAQQPWQFEGDFGNDSVWNLLNQYTPL